MTTLLHKPSDMRFPADTRAELMGLRATLRKDRAGLRHVADPELRRLLRKEAAVTQFDIRAIEEAQ